MDKQIVLQLTADLREAIEARDRALEKAVSAQSMYEGYRMKVADLLVRIENHVSNG
jgi:hypothetical protein